METESLSYKTLKNISYSFIGYIYPILFSIFITPIVVHRLGVKDYGIYIFVNTVTAFLTLADLGLLVALIKYIAEYHGLQDFKRLNDLLSSAYTLYWGIGLVGFLVFFAIGFFLLPAFHIMGATQHNTFVVFCLAGVLFFINTTNYIYTTAPVALQRFDIATKINLVQLTVLNISMVILVLMGYKLKAIFLVNIVTVVALVIVYRIYFKRLLPEISIQFKWVGSEIKKSYQFGLLAALTNLASNSLIQLDRFIIPIFIGPAQLTFYSLSGNVAQKNSGIIGSLGSVFFPLTSSMNGIGDMERLKSIYRKAFRNLTLLSAALASAIALFAHPILYYWLGEEFANRGAKILVILSATYFMLAIYAPLTNFLLGMGKVKFLTYFSISLATLNIIWLIILVPHYGITGAAWAYLLGVFPTPFAFYWTEKKFLHLDGTMSFYGKLYAKIICTAILYAAVVKFVLLGFITNIYMLIIIGPLSVLLFMGIYKLFGFYEDEDWKLLLAFSKKIKSKLVT